ncbi:MAG: 4-hydroxy-tetrahydrodipicolinate synthase [Alicyclobacillus macrosporangiidus]|uniref:4-hydroxy-tetrahydrodipicolinate synthase n=1 Tax=Alicyclobacillus macrosporangiidus TaxID=392015 RepID=UPI0026F01604|nr:4-hydroxy-tetrahydrodipicolinate synthase [Alicyclobacillus macrosporangiidus]MCL6597314.1 4-hydroxy-tetrahydrodipicolinate synthase [Alicyclobacillus macrosporangiidus]
MDFGRLVTAMATPFKPDGSLDESGLKSLVDHLIETGTTAIVACGTTGESPTLSHEEKLKVFEWTVRAAEGRVPVIAGTGSNDTTGSIALSREAQALGVDGVLLVSPYYNRPTQEGLYAHFSAIAEAVDLPVMVYNIPSRTGVNIEVDTMLRLAQVPNITSVKEASGNFSHILRLAAEKPDDLFLYSGDDKFTLPMMAVGGYGVVSVASHVVGPEMRAMIDAFVSGDTATARDWANRLLPVFEALFRVTSPSPLKAALRLLGLPGGGVRLPLVEAPDSVVEELRRELNRLGKHTV